MGRDREYPLSPVLETNLQHLLVALNIFRLTYGIPMRVTSGYRPGRYNEAAHGAQHSNHMVCLACDFADANGALDAWCLAHPDVLEKAGLYQESPGNTPGWCHLQSVAPASGSRVFLP